MSKTKNLNVAEAATEFLTKIKKNRGFNGVPLLVLELECIWHEQYAIFVLQFDTMFDDAPNDYVSFDNNAFQEDLDKAFQEAFPGCKINYCAGCFEYEIIGPDYEEFYAKHKDALEVFDEKNWQRHPKEPVIYKP